MSPLVLVVASLPLPARQIAAGATVPRGERRLVKVRQTEACSRRRTLVSGAGAALATWCLCRQSWAAPAPLGAAEVGTDGATLGSCAGLQSCKSTFDDRPPHFLAPWSYEGTAAEATRQLAAAVQRAGGSVHEAREGQYLHATFEAPFGGTDDLEFLLAAEGDATVSLRASARQQVLPDGGRLARRLEQLRLLLGWEEVPVLRNRTSFLGLPFETPWDNYGPVPPTGGVDLGSVDDALQ